MADNSSAKSKNKVSFSERDKRIAYIILSIIIVAATYFLGFQKLQEKKNSMLEANETLQAEVNNLRSMVSKQASVEADTAEKNKNTDKIYKKFPAEVRLQNAIYQLDEGEKGIKEVHIKSEGFTMNQILYANGQFSLDGTNPADANASSGGNGDGNAGNGDGGIVAKKSTIDVQFDSTYDAIKKFVDFINKNEERMKISELTFAKANGTNKLNCALKLDMFAVEGNDKEYEEPDVPYIMSGKKDITVR